MPKKAKKGGGKSVEGGLVPLQQKARAVDEMNRKEELLTLFLKDKLQKEQRNTAVNQLKLDEVWRTIFRQTRGTELQAAAAVYRQMFERQLDEQDSIIEKMLRELREAERQLAQVRHAHVQHLERMQAQQDKRLRSLEQHWGDILEHAGSTFSSEREQTLAQFQKQRVKLQSLMLSTEQRHEEETISIQQVYDDCQVHHEEYRQMPDDVEEHKTLQNSLLELEKLYVALSEKTEKNNHSRKNIERLQAISQHLKEKLVRVKLENKSHLEDLKAVRDEVNGKCHELQDWLNQTRSEARERLTRLTVQGDCASKKLQAAINKGEMVLRAAEICCKLENKPDISSPPSSSSQFLPSEDYKQALMAPLKAAMLQRRAALQHRDRLCRENEQLRLLIRQHVEDDTLDGRCAPLVISPAPETNFPPSADRRHTVIEGVHAIKYSL